MGGVLGDQDVGVEQIPVDEVAPLGTRADQVADSCCSGEANARAARSASYQSLLSPKRATSARPACQKEYAEDQDPPLSGCSSPTGPYRPARKSRAWLSATR